MALKHRPVFGDKKVIICVSLLSTPGKLLSLIGPRLFQLLCKPQRGTLPLQFTVLNIF